MLRSFNVAVACLAAILFPGSSRAGNDSMQVFHTQALLDQGKQLHVDLYLDANGQDRNFYVDFSRSVLTDCPSDLRTSPAPAQGMFTRTYGALPKGAWTNRSTMFVSEEVIDEKCHVRPYVEEVVSAAEHRDIEMHDAQSYTAYPAHGRSQVPAPGVSFSPALIETPGGHARATNVSTVMLAKGDSGRSIEVVSAEYVCSGEPDVRRPFTVQNGRSRGESPLKSIHFISDSGWPDVQNIERCKIVMSIRTEDRQSGSYVTRVDVRLVSGGRFVAVGNLAKERVVVQQADTDE